MKLVDRLQHELHKRTRRFCVLCTTGEAACLWLKVNVTPKSRCKRAGINAWCTLCIECSKCLQRETPAFACTSERNVTALWRHAPCWVSRAAADNCIDFFNRMTNLEVRILRRKTKFENDTIDLIENEHDRKFVAHTVADRCLCTTHDTFYHINNKDRTICETKRSGNLVLEVDMTWCVDDIEKIALTRRVRHYERHG